MPKNLPMTSENMPLKVLLYPSPFVCNVKDSIGDRNSEEWGRVMWSKVAPIESSHMTYYKYLDINVYYVFCCLAVI